MESVRFGFDEFRTIEEGQTSKGKLGQRSPDNDSSKGFKSKNLIAERKRRQKLSDRLLALRALVPRITNMNKATIIDDSITYVMELQNYVKDLTEKLHEIEASSEEAPPKRIDEIDAAQEMKNSGIEADVQVTNIGGEKLWTKIVLEKKIGGLTNLLNAMSFYGFEFTDTSVTTSKGAMLISSCVERTHGGADAVEQIKELLMEIIRNI